MNKSHTQHDDSPHTGHWSYNITVTSEIRTACDIDSQHKTWFICYDHTVEIALVLPKCAVFIDSTKGALAC